MRHIGFLILLACSTAAAQSVSDDFFPLAHGNEWMYHYFSVAEAFNELTGIADSGRATYLVISRDATADSIIWGIREALDFVRTSYSDWGGHTEFSRSPMKDTLLFSIIEHLDGSHSIVRPGKAWQYWRSVFCVMARTPDSSRVFRYVGDAQDDTLQYSVGWDDVNPHPRIPTYVLEWTQQRGVGLRSVKYSTPGITGGMDRSNHQLVSQTILSAGTVERSGSPGEFILENNYPNPFNASTVLSLSLHSREQVNLTIVDILGRKIAGLLDDTVGPGRVTIVWEASKQASGTYFAQVRTSRSVKCLRLLLLK